MNFRSRRHDYSDSRRQVKRRPALLLIAFAFLAIAMVSGPTARLAIQTHDLTDPSPRRIEATLALGKAALVLLITWTSRIR